MFTGIIETVAMVKEVITNGSNRSFWIESAISPELTPDQSVSHSGVCLTVEEISGNRHRVTAVEETLEKTNLADWEKGSLVNLERCLRLSDRLDGHMVQGHVDTTAICSKKKANRVPANLNLNTQKNIRNWLLKKVLFVSMALALPRLM